MTHNSLKNFDHSDRDFQIITEHGYLSGMSGKQEQQLSHTCFQSSNKERSLTLSGPGGGWGSEARMTKLTAVKQKPLTL